MFEEDGKWKAMQGSGDLWKEYLRVPHAEAVFEDRKQVATRWWPTLSKLTSDS